MAENDYNPFDSVASADELGAESGQKNESEVLKVLGEATGRTYESVDKAKEAIKETFSFVGKAGNYKKIVDTIANKLELGDEKGVLQWLETVNKSNIPTQEQLQDVQGKVDELTFLTGNPEAKEHLPFLKKLAKAEGNLEAAYNSEEFKEYLKLKKDSKASQEKSSVIESNQRVGIQSDKLKPLTEQFQKTGNIQDAESLVKEALGLEKK